MLAKRISNIFIILIVILSTVSPVQGEEETKADTSTNTNSEVISPSPKIVATPGMQPIQWNKIDKDAKSNLGSTIQNYNTDLFTGSASYSYPIEAAPGVNGLEPSISLSYNHHGALSPLSLLGNGWAVTSSYIYRDRNYTASNTGDDIFKIVLNGI